MRRAALLTVFVVSAAIVPGAQQTAPAPQGPALTFRSAANFVEVDAIVTDADGNPVRGLAAGDFDVREDGRPQSLSVCSFVNLPVTRPDPPLFRAKTVPPDVASNEKPFDGRVLMIVLDGYHVAPDRAQIVKRAAERFITGYMGENDLAAVVHVGDPEAGQEFTSSKPLLVESIERFAGKALASITMNLNQDAQSKDLAGVAAGGVVIDYGPPVDPETDVREYMARESLSTVRQLATNMGDLGGRRKALLFFSEGLGLDTMKIDDASGHASTSQTTVQAASDSSSVRTGEARMIAAAGKANVSIYTIDPRGVTTGHEDALELPSIAQAPDPGFHDYRNPTVQTDAQDESRRAQDSLRMYADQTGGLAIVNQNDLDDAFRRIIRDNSEYYVLGYATPDPAHDTRYHRLTVAVNRPGLRVRTWSGYASPEADRAGTPAGRGRDDVAALLRSPAPVSGLGMRVNASVIAGLARRSTVHLTVEFRGADVALKSSGGLFTNDIDVEYAALDTRGEPQASGHDVAHLQLRPDTNATFAETGVRYVTEFDLTPGRYQVRVAAREHLAGRTGSVFCDLDVPDAAAAPLALSDLLLTSSGAPHTPTPDSTSSIGTVLPAPTTTVRDFTAADTLTVAAAVQDHDARAAHDVSLTATVTSDAGAPVFRQETRQSSAAIAAARGGYYWVVPVPLAGLAAGRYVLTVEARSTLDAGAPLRRELEFRVR